jgi:serine/threonine protein kinase
MLQLSRGLTYLHARGIAHRDIKPNNVLVYAAEDGRSFVFRLGDFGAAKPVCVVEKNTPKLFYVEYRAPELLLRSTGYDYAPDVWALGCVFVEVVTGSSPFPGAKGVTNGMRLAQIVRALGTSQELVELARARKVELGARRRGRGLGALLKGHEEQDVGPLGWKRWLVLASRMLDVDARRRVGMRQVLAMLGEEEDEASFETETLVSIRECPCRTRALELLRLCDLPERWYDHAVDVVNRLTYTKNYEPPTHLVTAVVSLVSKYWSVELAPRLGGLLAQEVGKGLRGSRLERFERHVVRDALENRIYRPLLSDLTAGRVPRTRVLEASESPTSNGATVEQLARDLLARYGSKDGPVERR